MSIDRRQFIHNAFLGAAAAVMQSKSRAQNNALGIPGPYRGRVVAVEHSGCIISGVYQPEPIRQMMDRGMRDLTGAPNWTEAWRSMFEKGDVVGIKVSPVGGPTLCSDASVLHSIINGLNQAGVSNSDIIVLGRKLSRPESINGCRNVYISKRHRCAMTTSNLIWTAMTKSISWRSRSSSLERT